MFQIHQQYNRQQIYTILNVPLDKQKGEWNTGYIKYEGVFYLFVNMGIAGRTGHDYKNAWEDGHLIWFGKSRTNLRQPQVQALISDSAKVQIFVREKDRSPFTYLGYGRALSFADTTPVKIVWEIMAPGDSSTKEWIDPRIAWSIFYDNISKAFDNDPYFEKDNQYKVISVLENEVVIQASRGDATSISSLSQDQFVDTISRFSRSKGTVPKGSLVADEGLEAAIVWFLSLLDWDESKRNIICDVYYQLSSNHSPQKILNEAMNDTEVVAVTILKRLRRGQNKLRLLLLEQYEGKCCITGTEVAEVLNACHIEPHNVSGYNDSKNALLLRSDIHDLWDMGLIGIDPNTLKVHIHDMLGNTEYYTLQDKVVANRKDGQRPDVTPLTKRWDDFQGFSHKLPPGY